MPSKKEVETAIRSRQVICNRLDEFEKYLAHIEPNNIPIYEFKVRLSKTTELWDKFQDVQNIISHHEDSHTSEAIRKDFEDRYFTVIGKAEELLANSTAEQSKNDRVGQRQEPDCDVRLPTIQVPIFSGNFDEWLSFYNIFNDLVHDNKFYRESTKLKYLKNSLRGEAYSVIESLDLTAENYKVALQLLKERYDNPTRAVQKHIACLFEQPKIEKESSAFLRSLLENFRKHIRALKSLGQETDTWDCMLIHLLTSKLDNYTFREWKKVTPAKELPTIPMLFEFLEQHCIRIDEIKRHQSANQITKPKSTEQKNSRCFVADNKRKGCIAGCKEEHALYLCKKFKDMTVDKRYSLVKSNRLCLNCFSHSHSDTDCNSSSCRICSRRHHTLLHRNVNSTNTVWEKTTSSQPASSNTKSTTNCNTARIENSPTALISVRRPSQVLLSTASILVYGHNGKRTVCRALLDSGSQSSYITTDFCDQLGLKRKDIKMTTCGFNNASIPIYHRTEAKVASCCTSFTRTLQFLVVPNITDYNPQIDIDLKKLALPDYIQVADPNLNNGGKINMLLGANIFWDLVGQNKHDLPAHSLSLRETTLGWVLVGQATVALATQCCLGVDDSLDSVDDNIRKFWQLESLGTGCVLSTEEVKCEQFYKASTRRNKDQRYVVQMPLKNDLRLLGDSREIALRRFHGLEARFERDAELKRRYKEFIQEYIDLGHMIETSVAEVNLAAKSYFVPHHPVFKETSSSTKIRVVFDFSTKTSSGYSLNDILAVGPTIQPLLYNHLVRIRTYNILICGDLEKMFRQILIDETQTPLQLIFWRDNPDEPLKIYKLLTVSYGTSCASWISTRTLKQLALDHTHHVTSYIIENHFYMDDLGTGCDSSEQAIQMKELLTSHLKLGGFHIRKWSSNSLEFMDTIPDEDRELKYSINLDKESSVRTLGLLWLPIEDAFSFAVNINEFTKNHGVLTKRSILSTIAKLFDPLGLLGPVITKAKIFMQEMWQQKYDWDEPISELLAEKWLKYCNSMLTLKELKIPRRVIPEDCVTIEIHAYCDASMKAYGGCLYFRCIDKNNRISVQLVASKSRVAPLKVQSLPRLELCAALLLCELVMQTLPSFAHLKINQIWYWSDSRVVLSWINGSPSKQNIFVANRVAKIQELTTPMQWRHVCSPENPADPLSRGTYVDQLCNDKLWWHGPTFLSEPHSSQDQGNFIMIDETQLPEMKKPTTTALVSSNNNRDNSHIINCLLNSSSFSRMVRTLSYCLRFLRRSRLVKGTRPIGPITLTEFEEAKVIILRLGQQIMFPEEYRSLIVGGNIKATSNIAKLTPFLDDNKLIRVGGRLQQAEATSDMKHPILLAHGSSKSVNKLTALIAKDIHQKNCHIGPQALLALMREQYWPINGRNLCRSIFHKCIRCFRAKPRFKQQIMGNLPRPRVEVSSPFSHCGVDFAGPILVRNSMRRNASTSKAYICLFICLCTKAVHIELVEDLSTKSFIAALRRFTARRGKPAVLYTDNATNFVGARNELSKLEKLLVSEVTEPEIANFFVDNKIEWKFIPPQSPNFGGLWEANIKQVKILLKRTIGNTVFSFNELYTVLTQVEAALNSRPLFPLPSNPDDLSVLTPAHFLIGGSLIQPAQDNLTTQPSNRLKRWDLVQRMVQHFWKRWSTEYLQELQRRSRWTLNVDNLSKGTLVLIKNELAPPLSWTLGRIADTHPGPDGKVRVATVKTSSGIYKRNVRHLCPLPTEEDDCPAEE